MAVLLYCSNHKLTEILDRISAFRAIGGVTTIDITPSIFFGVISLKLPGFSSSNIPILLFYGQFFHQDNHILSPSNPESLSQNVRCCLIDMEKLLYLQ